MSNSTGESRKQRLVTGHSCNKRRPCVAATHHMHAANMVIDVPHFDHLKAYMCTSSS
jgi:hypothetical protein